MNKIESFLSMVNKNNIKYEVINEENLSYVCYRKKDNRAFQFCASTGEIKERSNARGLLALEQILLEN